MKLLTLNIEGDRHLGKVVELLLRERPEVTCLQEVFKQDITLLEKATKTVATFGPMVSLTEKNIAVRLKPKGEFGIAILTPERPKRVFLDCYFNCQKDITDFFEKDVNASRRVLLTVQLAGPVDYVVTTTIFLRSKGGKDFNKQLQALPVLMSKLKKYGQFILAGDFNAPRGGPVYKGLVKIYRDCLPSEIMSTIDPKLNRVRNLETVVDYIFSTSDYLVRNVRVIEGVSDHKAVVAEVSRDENRPIRYTS